MKRNKTPLFSASLLLFLCAFFFSSCVGESQEEIFSVESVGGGSSEEANQLEEESVGESKTDEENEEDRDGDAEEDENEDVEEDRTNEDNGFEESAGEEKESAGEEEESAEEEEESAEEEEEENNDEESNDEESNEEEGDVEGEIDNTNSNEEEEEMNYEDGSSTVDANTQAVLDRQQSFAEAISKFVPRFIFSEGEKYFPSKAEDIPGTLRWNSFPWTSVTNASAVLEFGASSTGQPFSSTAPVYVNVRYYGPTQIWITYVHAYNYNDCGPVVSINGKAYGTVVSQDVSPCPVGVNNGDLEHVTISLSSNLTTILGVYFSRQSGAGVWVKRTDTTTWANLKWDGTHVYVYPAKGSHNNYYKTGKSSTLMTLMDQSVSGASLTITLTESPDSKGQKWNPSARWIAINGRPYDSLGLTDIEKKFSLLMANFGSVIQNTSTVALQNTIWQVTAPVRTSSTLDLSVKRVNSGLDAVLQPQPSSTCGLGGKRWWGGNGNADADA